MENKFTTIKIDKDTHKKLAELASENDRTIAGQLRNLVKKAEDEKNKKEEEK